MISTKSLYLIKTVQPNLPYSGKLIKELNKRQHNKLQQKNKFTRKHLINPKITPINQDIPQTTNNTAE